MKFVMRYWKSLSAATVLATLVLRPVRLESLEDLSERDEDPDLKRLESWVRLNGGMTNVEARRDKKTGVRGLYATMDINDP
jgi:hypothetical protein